MTCGSPAGARGLIAEVAACGLATVQDSGRPGFARVGVATSGAWHRERYQIARALLGSLQSRPPAPGPPTAEIWSGRFALDVRTATWITVVGPAHCTVDGDPIASGVVLAVAAGSRVVVDEPGPGPVYLAVAGWSPDLVLGSASTDTFGGLGGRVLAPGDLFEGAVPRSADAVGSFARPVPDDSGPIRVIAAGDWVLAGGWTVATTSRSGLRLRPPDGFRPQDPTPIASAPVVPGAIQLTPAGEAIVLGPDGGVTGGYPVVGVVATVDLSRLSLLAAGDRIAFATVDPRAAADLMAARTARLRRSLGHPDLAR